MKTVQLGSLNFMSNDLHITLSTVHNVINHVVPSKKGARSSGQLFRAC